MSARARSIKFELVEAPPVAPAACADAALLLRYYLEAQQGLRKVVSVGLFAHEVKGRLKHGSFGKWVAKNCPAISYRALATYMQMTEGVCKMLGVPLLRLGKAAQIEHPHQLLLLPEEELASPKARDLQQQIFALIDGRSQKQLLLECRDLDSRRGGKRNRTKKRAPKTEKQILAESVARMGSFFDEMAAISAEQTWLAVDEPALLLAIERAGQFLARLVAHRDDPDRLNPKARPKALSLATK